MQQFLIFGVSFAMISLAAKQIGRFFARLHLPLISGFLFAGILAGPYIIDLISAEGVKALHFVDEVALAFIAFVAGSELFFKDFRGRLASIKWITILLVIFSYLFGSAALFFLCDYLPFTEGMSTSGKLAVSLLAGAIMIARSPSSAVAVIKELRAKGPFTTTALGVTVITDVAVIVFFAINSSIADAVFTNAEFKWTFTFFLMGELLFSVFLGYLLSRIIGLVLSAPFSSKVKVTAILLLGYGVFALSKYVRQTSHVLFDFEILLEPLLICMVAGFCITNFSDHRQEYSRVLEKVASPIYVAFFTLTGASLTLDILIKIWPIALVLFAVRVFAIFLGSFWGGVLAGDRMRHNKFSWMVYLTQAGVGLGLAKQVAAEFPSWGNEFATLIIAVIVINQVVGPIFFKWAINAVKESHVRGKNKEFEGSCAAVIFGSEGQSFALALQLRSHNWKVRIASKKIDQAGTMHSDPDVPIIPFSDVSVDMLKQVGCNRASTAVLMMSDELNYEVAELIYENYGKVNLVVNVNNRDNYEKFKELGALAAVPSTAIVSLLDHFVRAPSAASLMLGMEHDKDIIDIEVKNPHLYGISLRDMKLPSDILILSVKRAGEMLIVHGNIRFKVGDTVTLLGYSDSLDEVSLMFDV